MRWIGERRVVAVAIERVTRIAIVFRTASGRITIGVNRCQGRWRETNWSYRHRLRPEGRSPATTMATMTMTSTTMMNWRCSRWRRAGIREESNGKVSNSFSLPLTGIITNIIVFALILYGAMMSPFQSHFSSPSSITAYYVTLGLPDASSSALRGRATVRRRCRLLWPSAAVASRPNLALRLSSRELHRGGVLHLCWMGRMVAVGLGLFLFYYADHDRWVWAIVWILHGQFHSISITVIR